MTQMMHNIIAYGLFILTWFFVLKPYFVKPEEFEFWRDKFGNYFDWNYWGLFKARVFRLIICFCCTNMAYFSYEVLAASTLAADAGAYLYLLPEIVRNQEKEADVLAVKTLIQIGSKQIADIYIDQIKDTKISAENGVWWPSIDEQILYFELARNESTHN